jgi:hypothetical protein
MKLKRLILIPFLFFACSSESEPPENLISQDKMVDVLVDLQLLEATYNIKLVLLDNRSERMNRYTLEVFNHHQITQAMFDSSYAYYEKDPEALINIYEHVFEKLEALEAADKEPQN